MISLNKLGSSPSVNVNVKPKVNVNVNNGASREVENEADSDIKACYSDDTAIINNIESSQEYQELKNEC